MLKKTEAGGGGAKDGAIALDGPTPHGETKKATDAPGMRLPPPQLIDEKNEKMFSVRGLFTVALGRKGYCRYQDLFSAVVMI